MPQALKRPCRWAGCSELVSGKSGWCQEHTKTSRRQADSRRDRSAARRVYNSSRWKRLRRMILRRQPNCECGEATNEVDHIDGDVTNCRWDNLQAMCKRCHSRKTAKEDGGYGKRR